jgi:hypothetical protein
MRSSAVQTSPLTPDSLKRTFSVAQRGIEAVERGAQGVDGAFEGG